MNWKKNKFPLLLECFVWLFYVGIYKYGYYLQQAALPNNNHDNFPHLSLMGYAVALTLYIIPFYRYIAPALLQRRQYGWILPVIMIYFWFVPKLGNWLVSYVFMHVSGEPVHRFYTTQFNLYRLHAMHLFTGWDLKILLTDCVAFLLLVFTRYAFAIEQGRRQLQKEYFQLQVEALKGQLNPHFLFNMLNSIYGMSLTGSPDTSAYILRMSDMMRYILYDCKEATVPVRQDLQFLENYIAMEKKRYPGANIRFSIMNETGERPIVPLLLVPFIENSFKHGAHRVMDKGIVEGSVIITETELQFTLENDSLPSLSNETKYRGVGINNVKQRLALYYPGKHILTISNEANRYRVHLIIKF